MKFAYYLRQPGAGPHEAVAHAIKTSAERCGDSVEVFTPETPIQLFNEIVHDTEALIFWGIGGDAKRYHNLYQDLGKRIVLLDKPYTRGGTPAPTRYHLLRVSIDNLHPTAYFRQIKRPADRWDALGVPFVVERSQAFERKEILFDGASNKYCLWLDLPPWGQWGEQMVSKIRQHAAAPHVVYRPRPSHNPPPRVVGARLSEGPIEEDFHRAKLVVSHGGNIGFDCIVRGIPHFAIGNSAARSISETDWHKVGEPRVVSAQERLQWLYDIAYCQWTLDEFAEGAAWRYVRTTLDLVQHLDLRRRINESGAKTWKEVVKVYKPEDWKNPLHGTSLLDQLECNKGREGCRAQFDNMTTFDKAPEIPGEDVKLRED